MAGQNDNNLITKKYIIFNMKIISNSNMTKKGILIVRLLFFCVQCFTTSLYNNVFSGKKIAEKV